MATEQTKEIIEARRRFLQQCGKFSVATPPVVALLLATADRSYAAALSGRVRAIMDSAMAAAMACPAIPATIFAELRPKSG